MKTLLTLMVLLFSYFTSAAKEEVESTNPVEPQEKIRSEKAELDPYEEYLQEEEADEALDLKQQDHCVCPPQESVLFPSNAVYFVAPQPRPQPEQGPSGTSGYDSSSYKPIGM